MGIQHIAWFRHRLPILVDHMLHDPCPAEGTVTCRALPVDMASSCEVEGRRGSIELCLDL